MAAPNHFSKSAPAAPPPALAAAATAVAPSAAEGPAPLFEASPNFFGARPGAIFKLGPNGLGYYRDALAPASAAEAISQVPGLRPQLPERWRDCGLREELLRVDPASGAGLCLGKCEFGLKVEGVEASPGQQVRPGDVIVAVEGRLLAGLSGAQMQASFLKRFVDGAKLQVAVLEEVQELSERDPAVVEQWDPRHQRAYYFHKKTGKSGWTWEELKPEADALAAASAGSSTPAAGSARAAVAPPVDLANFLTRGFAQEKQQAPKKRKKPEAPTVTADESDLARQERARWKHWNEGGRGGYTEQFFEKYKNCQSNPAKPKDDKRLKGSVGPGQGMEYMARWTGSKNSFN